MKTLIFDNDHRLHWISAQEIYLDALQEFDKAAGVDAHKRELNPASWTFCRVTDERAEEIADSQERGCPVIAFPLRRRAN